MVDSGGRSWLTAGGDDSEAVVSRVSEAVSAPLNELYFSKALDDTVVFGGAPHGGDFTHPRPAGEPGDGVSLWVVGVIRAQEIIRSSFTASMLSACFLII